MADAKKENLSASLRELAQNIEKAAYDMSQALSPTFTSELLEISARLSNAANAAERQGLSARSDITADSFAMDTDPTGRAN
ncbi:MAG: hypothetical protein QNJ20_15210 [Paracoccaceae bacterium]|nr:hypothetical protein [Paracoccaceae bacterium]